jgi:hypothetical protein
MTIIRHFLFQPLLAPISHLPEKNDNSLKYFGIPAISRQVGPGPLLVPESIVNLQVFKNLADITSECQIRSHWN